MPILTRLKKYLESNKMKRIAFKMKLYPGFEAEYKKRHEQLWPELRSLLKKAGVSDYSIFFDGESDTLFAVLKVNNNELFDRLASTQIMQKWWDHMSDIMETNEDNSPVAKALTELFYLQ